MSRLMGLILAFFITVPAEAKAITAKSFVIADSAGEILAEKNPNRSQPIASITKLMTVKVVLDANQNLQEQLELDFSQSRRYHTHLPRYLKSLSRDQLIKLAIVKSDNFAAYTLCRNYPGGIDNCVTAMNRESQRLGMKDSQFADPTGLDPKNISTARDLVKLILAAQAYPSIVNASALAKVSIELPHGHADFPNTNPMVRMGEDVIVSKTGYINSSGGCIAMLLQTADGPRVVIVLGSRSTKTRVPEARKILAAL